MINACNTGRYLLAYFHFPSLFYHNMKANVCLLAIWACICIIGTLQAQSCKTGKLNPQVAEFIKSMPANDRSVAEIKKTINFEEYKKGGPPAIPYPAADVERIKITADSIPVMVFNPVRKKGLSIIIAYHGGGFIQPLVPWMEHRFWYEAIFYNAIVFAVDYRVAPEHKFPVPVEDSYAAFKWISENGHRQGGDTSRIILTGTSAGTNLVAVVCQKAKKEGIAKKIKLQIMNCPVTDNPNHTSRYPSMQENEKDIFSLQTMCYSRWKPTPARKIITILILPPYSLLMYQAYRRLY